MLQNYAGLAAWGKQPKQFVQITQTMMRQKIMEIPETCPSHRDGREVWGAFRIPSFQTQRSRLADPFSSSNWQGVSWTGKDSES